MATAAAVTESRQDLLNWMNDLLQLNITKIEQICTGAILCQIFDSIYGNVALHKVRFNTHQEYEYIQNFKVLQSCFTQNGVDKYIPVDRLIKGKFQENLEFLQWVKKFWDCNYPGGHYDAVGRRGGKAVASESSDIRTAPLRPQASMAVVQPPRPAAVSRPAEPKTSNMAKELAALRLSVDEAERERDFYFGKLRDIEIEIQKLSDAGPLPDALQTIAAILYKTDEGFESPEPASMSVD